MPNTNMVDPASKFGWGIGSITFSGGETIRLESGSTLVLVGPNASGKSTALAQLVTNLKSRSAPGPGSVVGEVQPFKEGTLDDWRAWLERHFKGPRVAGSQYYRSIGGDLNENALHGTWIGVSNPRFDGAAAAFLVQHLSAEGRLSSAADANRVVPFDGNPEYPIHLIESRPEQETIFREHFRAAFGQDIVLDHGQGKVIGFRVGPEPPRTAEDDRVSKPYLEALRQNQKLAECGDGMRSFAGSLLAAICGAQPVLLIDEPELFLHPPQARRLASALAQAMRTANRQMIMATHSADVVEGALAGSDKVTVCRIVREGDVNHGYWLNPGAIKEMTAHPLRGSRSAISGAFHQGVVACESEADCRFYRAALESLEQAGQVRGPLDLEFVNGHGKGSIATLVHAYSELSVKVAAIVDLDLLSEWKTFEKAVAAFGVDPSPLKNGAIATRDALAKAQPELSPEEWIARVRALVETVAATKQVDPVRGEIKRLTQRTSSWGTVTALGIERLADNARDAAQDLLRRCREFGLFILPVGCLESWWRDGPGSDKSEWFEQAMDRLESMGPTAFPALAPFMLQLALRFDAHVAPVPSVPSAPRKLGGSG